VASKFAFSSTVFCVRFVAMELASSSRASSKDASCRCMVAVADACHDNVLRPSPERTPPGRRPEPVFPPALEQKSDAEAPGVSRSFATRSHMHRAISGPNVLVVEARFHRSWSNNFAARGRVYLPRGVVISVPDGGVNPNVDGGIGPVTWFEYVVTMRSPFGCNISVRCARDSALI
jgi:hypothetical protein